MAVETQQPELRWIVPAGEAVLGFGQGDDAEGRQAEQPFDLLGTAHRVVQELEQEGEPDAAEETQHEPDEAVAHRFGLGRLERRLRGIDHRDVVLPRTRGHPDLLHALEEPVVELVVGLHLALENLVLHPALVEREHLIFLGIDGRAQRLLLLAEVVVAGEDALEHPLLLLLDALPELVDAVLELDHRRVVGLELRRELRVLGARLHALLPQLGDERVVGDGVERLALARADGVALDAHREALGLNLGELLIELLELLLADLDALLQVRHVVAAREVLKRLVRALELGLHARELGLEELTRLLARLVAALEVRLDVLVDQGVGGPFGEVRVEGAEGDVHELRVAHGLDREPLEEAIGGLGLLFLHADLTGLGRVAGQCARHQGDDLL